jgi:hypothetical protein
VGRAAGLWRQFSSPARHLAEISGAVDFVVVVVWDSGAGKGLPAAEQVRRQHLVCLCMRECVWVCECDDVPGRKSKSVRAEYMACTYDFFNTIRLYQTKLTIEPGQQR